MRWRGRALWWLLGVSSVVAPLAAWAVLEGWLLAREERRRQEEEARRHWA